MNPRKAFDSIERAIENAKKYLHHDSNHIPLLFSTDMPSFAKKIWEYIHIEFQKKREKEKRIQGFKKNLDPKKALNLNSERVQL
jgi:hypothetical protein